ncbi:MAG TPA: ABC transporter substrate-binding protein [Thermomicrobiales bacterium]|nr:ABC transporter substrate-binding protein [Thermomicrobiales bacterium]
MDERNRIEALTEMEPAEVMAGYRRGEISRRDLLRLLAAVGLASSAEALLGRGAAAQAQDLTMVIWEGYADPSFAEKFEQENDATISATPMTSSDDAFARIQAGGGSNFDLVSASNDVSQRLIDAGLVQPIDPSRLSNYNDLFPQFQRPSYITKDDQLYGANFAWGPTLMIYNSEEVTEAPTSWRALLDERYEGRVSTWNAPIQIAQYALLLDPKPENPYELDDEQLAQVKDLLLQQRPLIRTYWNYGDELKQLLASGEVVISDAWPYVAVGSREAGLPVVEVIPSEGVTGWSDSWMLTAGAQNVDLAYKWMDYMIGPDGQLGVLRNNNYAITNRVVIDGLDAQLRTDLRMDNIEEGYDQILMWRNVPNYDKWLQVWQEATTG